MKKTRNELVQRIAMLEAKGIHNAALVKKAKRQLRKMDAKAGK